MEQNSNIVIVRPRQKQRALIHLLADLSETGVGQKSLPPTGLQTLLKSWGTSETLQHVCKVLSGLYRLQMELQQTEKPDTDI